MRSVTRQLSVGFTFLLIASSVINSQVAAQEIKWRLHSVWNTKRIENEWAQGFADRVNQRSNKRLEITVYPGGSLGLQDADLLRTLPSGAVEMAVLYPGYLNRDAPELAFLYPNTANGDLASHEKIRPTLMEIYKDLYKKWDIVTVGAFQLPINEVHVLCKNEPVRTLAQLKGKKLRVWEKHVQETFKKLGVSAQIIPQNDLYMAMSTGVVDCAFYPLVQASTISLEEVVHYASALSFVVAPPPSFIVNKAAWDKLPADLQQVVLEAGSYIFNASSAAAYDAKRDQIIIDQVVGKGIKLLAPFPEEERRAYLKAAREAWLELSKEVGPAAVANSERLKAAIEK